PAWADIPPPSREELISAAEQMRQQLLAHADAVMLDWRTELMLGEISDANRGKLSAWLAYKNEVKAVDVTTDPENVNWPVPPGL
ncbi:tail fiber assembly protein, partial [Salmonella enterica]|nr:tail fiber assembly protein [Salmonella enterica]